MKTLFLLFLSIINNMIKCSKKELEEALKSFNKLRLLVYKEIMRPVIKEGKVTRCYNVFNVL